VEVRGAIALPSVTAVGEAVPELRIDGGRLPDLRLKAEAEFQRASSVISRVAHARDCFHWDGDVVKLTDSGHVDIKKAELGRWLQARFKALCDAQNHGAPIPRQRGGLPSLNPERWGVWPGCNRELWAWRQLVRMAEVLRILKADKVVRPRYETLPRLRSLEPNLAVYRSLNVPVFKPGQGHVFIAGRFRFLRSWCLAAVHLNCGYVPSGVGWLDDYLRRRNPLAFIGRQLFIAFQSDRGNQGDKADHVFSKLKKSQEARYRRWLKLTRVLLETAPLGLPSSLLAAFLQNEYGLNGLSTLRLENLLSTKVAWLTGAVLEDDTVDLVAGRLGMTTTDAYELLDPDHPETSGAALRNEILRKTGRHSEHHLQHPDQAAASDGSPPLGPKASKQTLECRALTLGGRMTFRSSQAIVRQQQILLAADEVMLEVAFALAAEGYRVVGVAGDEFVIEHPEATAEEVMPAIEKKARSVARVILRGLVPRMTVRRVKRW
jgi:hypothetical protein